MTILIVEVIGRAHLHTNEVMIDDVIVPPHPPL